MDRTSRIPKYSVCSAVLTCLLIAPVSADAGEAAKSKWGAQDQIGAANLLTPETAQRAARLVKKGKTYSLGLTIDDETAGALGRSYSVQITKLPINDHESGHDDRASVSYGIGTQLDSFAHYGYDGRHYNGISRDDVFGESGVRKLGIEGIPPIATRGVLLDVVGFRGETLLPGDVAIGPDMLEAIARKQGTPIQKGDVVLLNTGWLEAQALSPEKPPRASGLNKEGAQYLADKGAVAVGIDNPGLEGPKPPGSEIYPVHHTLLVDNGVYIMENIRTNELARDKAYEFMFVLGVPKMKGAVQAIIHPIAIN